jgi:hypothetical protein
VFESSFLNALHESSGDLNSRPTSLIFLERTGEPTGVTDAEARVAQREEAVFNQVARRAIGLIRSGSDVDAAVDEAGMSSSELLGGISTSAEVCDLVKRILASVPSPPD